MPAPEWLLPHDAENGVNQAETWSCRAAIAAAALRWLRPAAGAPPVCKGRARRAQTPATTPQSLTCTPQLASCESRGMQAEFAFFSSRGRQGERGGSERTSVSIVAELSRNVELLVGHEERRDRALAPDTQEMAQMSACGQVGDTHG